jgi:hypothetical protein
MKAEGTAARPAFRSRRLALIAAVALALAPGTFVRTPIDTRADPAVVTITARPERAGVSGELTLTGAWELTSPNSWFGGFSALVAGPGQSLIAGSDRGFLFDIDLAGPAPRPIDASFRFVGMTGPGLHEYVDLESLARDPETGRLWAGYEGINRIVTYPVGGGRRFRDPPELKEWSYNSGPEAMVRLADRRFVVLAEGTLDGSDTLHEALLFARNPLVPQTPLASRVELPAGYDPVDATEVPDGRVLILLRRVEYTVPAARFDTAITVADPREIRPGGTWRTRVIQHLEGGIFADNFEGIAFVASPEDPQRGAVWVITDDNFSVFQRSLLVRFDWPGEAPTKPAP